MKLQRNLKKISFFTAAMGLTGSVMAGLARKKGSDAVGSAILSPPLLEAGYSWIQLAYCQGSFPKNRVGP